MRKKSLILTILSFIAFFSAWPISAMNMNSLTYEDLLTLYFWVLAPEWNQTTNQQLKYTNVDKGTKLYSLLSIAVSNNKYPNLNIALPLKKTAYESDLADLIRNNFNTKISYTNKKVLTFDFLQTQLKQVYGKKSNTATPTQNSNTTKANENIADSVLFLLKENYINKDQLSWTDKVDYDSLSNFVEGLWEEYTVYYNPEEWKKFMDWLNGEFAGIGVYLIQRWDENPIISEVIKDSPAEKAWLQAEDILVTIGWKYLKDFKSSTEFIDALKGEKWSTVSVQIQRNGRILTKEISRDVIQLPKMDGVKLWDVCYVRMYSFDIWSYDSFMSKINEFWSCWKYVFDVRSNPGWVIDEVTWILEEFVPEWKILMTEKWTTVNEEIKSTKTPSLEVTNPTIILIDWYTASAAEIFAWVMKYYFPNQVKLVGSKTYGKGSVQQVVQFPNNSLIKYTIAIWYIADQTISIDKVWIQPDINVVDSPYTAKDEVLEVIWISNVWN